MGIGWLRRRMGQTGVGYYTRLFTYKYVIWDKAIFFSVLDIFCQNSMREGAKKEKADFYMDHGSETYLPQR